LGVIGINPWPLLILKTKFGIVVFSWVL
jgi:hypothetical protein